MRKIKKPQGLTLLDSGPFFWYGVNDEGHVPRDYTAVVEANSYATFTQATCLIRTPAQQFIWNTVERDMPYRDEDTQRRATVRRTCFTLTPFVIAWLNANAPQWAAPRYHDAMGGLHPGVYFDKRAHALAFCKFVDESLKDLKL